MPKRVCRLRRAATVLLALFGVVTIVTAATALEAKVPGSILNVWPLTGGGPGNGNEFRSLYRSTRLNGEPIEVSAAIFIPPSPAPARGRDIIAWAHPTSGIVTKCAPSPMPDVSGMIWGLPQMLAKGYIVVATHYPRLGAPRIHPFLVRESEGRA